MFDVRFGWPHIGWHACSCVGQSVQRSPGEANVPAQGEVLRRVLEIFNGAGKHRTSLGSVLVNQPAEGGGEELRKHLHPLRGPIPIGWDVRNQGSPRALRLGAPCRCRHATVEGVKHGIFPRNLPFIQGCFSQFHDLCNVFNVLLSSKETSTGCACWMWAFNLNATH